MAEMTELFRVFSTISFFFDKGIAKPRNIGYNMIDGEATNNGCFLCAS